MEAFKLRSGTEIPAIGLGTWEVHGQAVYGAVQEALSIGYRLIDTARVYENVPEVGKAITDSSVPRDEIFLTTKVWKTDDPIKSLQGQLQQLGMNQVDLTLVHWPPDRSDPGVNLWRGLIDAKAQGMTREIGVSNYSAAQIDTLIQETGEAPALNQIEWTPFGHAMELLDYAKDNQILLEAYSPLAQMKKLDHPQVKEIAERQGRTPGQVVLRWDIQLGLVPIPRSKSPEHIAENFDVFDFKLSKEEMDTLTGLNEQFSIMSGLPYV